MIGTKLIDAAAKVLYDETNFAFSRGELLDYLASAINAIVAAKPDAYSVQKRWQLQEGSVQSLPSDGTYLIRILRNAGADGTKPGRAIQWTELEELNRADPNWHNAPQSNTVEQYAYDMRDQKFFYVYPPMEFPPSWVEGVYNAAPARYVDETQPLPLDDLYEDALRGYVVGRALMRGTGREGEEPDNARAALHMQVFTVALNAIATGQAATEQLRRR